MPQPNSPSDSTEPNPSPTEIEEEEITDDFPETQEEQIQWLRAQNRALMETVEAMQLQVAESQLPSPESIQEMVTTVLEPELTAIRETIAELQSTASASPTPPAPEPEPTPQPPTEESPTEPQEIDPAENPEPEPAAPEPVAPQPKRRRVVKV